MAVEHYEVVISATLAGQFVQTVQHVKATIASPVNAFASALLIAQDIATNGIIDAWCDMLPGDWVGSSIRVKKVDGSGGPTAIVLVGDWSQAVGQRAGGISSAQVNPLIIWIGTTTPDKTGRLFVPGVAEDDIDNMIIVAPLLALYQTFISAWIAGGTVGGVDSYHGCIVRRTTGAPPHVFASGDLIFAGQVSPLIGTQRKRLHPV
jgi:hypothetical protein